MVFQGRRGQGINQKGRPNPSSFQVFQFPAGIFEIDEQFLVPAGVSILGADKPNDMAEPTKTPDWKTQTLFLATKGDTLPGFGWKLLGSKHPFLLMFWSFWFRKTLTVWELIILIAIKDHQEAMKKNWTNMGEQGHIVTPEVSHCPRWRITRWTTAMRRTW